MKLKECKVGMLVRTRKEFSAITKSKGIRRAEIVGIVGAIKGLVEIIEKSSKQHLFGNPILVINADWLELIKRKK